MHLQATIAEDSPHDVQTESGPNTQECFDRTIFLLLALAVLLGTSVRLIPVLSFDFPLNDGGMFYAMTEDLQQNSYRLPLSTSYNAAGIPFVYPPLGLYLTALIDAATGRTMLDTLRIVPALLSILCLGAFVLLTQDVLPSRAAVVAAVFVFALLPAGFLWCVMGGGITRGLGFLFTILALQQIYRLYMRGRRWHLPLAILLAAATVLSHPQQAWFLLYSALIMFLAKSRNRQGLISSLLLAAGTLTLTAPWWLTVVGRYGVAPFAAAMQHGWPLTNGLVQLLISGGTQEPFVPVIAFLALLGAVDCARRRDWWLPAWLLAVFALDSWLPSTVASVPMALLAGIGVAQVLVPSIEQGVNAVNHSSLERVSARPVRWVVALVLAFLVVYTVFSALVAGNSFLAALSEEEQAAMAWVADNTPGDGRFLVVTADRWGEDRSSEWFPALAKRTSVATVQGSEWLGNGAFARRVRASAALQLCASSGVQCLERWITDHRANVSHVYVPKRAPAPNQFQRPGTISQPDDCCLALRNSLAHDQRYTILYDGPGATVYVRQGNGNG